MKRIGLIFLLAGLLGACTSAPAEPMNSSAEFVPAPPVPTLLPPVSPRPADRAWPDTAWAQTVQLDGRFEPGEWPGTGEEQPGFAASDGEHRLLVSWDEDWLYLALTGPAASRRVRDASQVWWIVHFGLDAPTAAARNWPSSPQAQAFRSQSFDLDFEAHFALKWRSSDGFYNSARPIPAEAPGQRDGWSYTTDRSRPGWNPLGVSPDRARRQEPDMPGLEIAIAWEQLGWPQELRLVSYVLNEHPGRPSTTAFVPADLAVADDPEAAGLKQLQGALVFRPGQPWEPSP